MGRAGGGRGRAPLVLPRTDSSPHPLLPSLPSSRTTPRPQKTARDRLRQPLSSLSIHTPPLHHNHTPRCRIRYKPVTVGGRSSPGVGARGMGGVGIRAKPSVYGGRAAAVVGGEQAVPSWCPQVIRYVLALEAVARGCDAVFSSCAPVPLPLLPCLHRLCHALRPHPPLPRPRTPPPTVVITPPHRPFSPSSLTSCDSSSSLARSSMHPARVTTIVIVAIVVAIGGAGGLYYASQNGAAGRTQYNTKKSYSHSSSSSHSKRDDVSKRGAAAAAMRSFKGVSAGPARHYGTNGAVLCSPVLLLLLLTLPLVHLSSTSRPPLAHLTPSPSLPSLLTLSHHPVQQSSVCARSSRPTGSMMASGRTTRRWMNRQFANP